MFKVVSLFFVALVAFFVVGCGGGGSSNLPSDSEKVALSDKNSRDVALYSAKSILYTTASLENSANFCEFPSKTFLASASNSSFISFL